jgi:hypothetical protein
VIQKVTLAAPTVAITYSIKVQVKIPQAKTDFGKQKLFIVREE